MDTFSDIIKAWAVSFNPTEEQKELADLRYNICISCDQRGNILGIEKCNKCGCPLSKKIFTQKKAETCPLNKWDSVEKEFRKKKLESSKYRLI
jgi:hypothetical protein